MTTSQKNKGFTEKKLVTITLSTTPTFRARMKTMAALNGISVSHLVQTCVDYEWHRGGYTQRLAQLTEVDDGLPETNNLS